VLWMGPWNL